MTFLIQPLPTQSNSSQSANTRTKRGFRTKIQHVQIEVREFLQTNILEPILPHPTRAIKPRHIIKMIKNQNNLQGTRMLEWWLIRPWHSNCIFVVWAMKGFFVLTFFSLDADFPVWKIISFVMKVFHKTSVHWIFYVNTYIKIVVP